MKFEVVKRKTMTFSKALFKRFGDAEVSNNAIVLSYYSLLSVFPAVMFLGSILPLLNVHSDTALAYIKTAVPPAIYEIMGPIVKDFLEQGNGGVFSLSVILTLYSASQVVAAFRGAINRAYGIDKPQNSIVNRIISFILTIIIVVVMGILIIVFSFSQAVVEYLTPILKLPRNWFDVIGQVKWPLTLVGIFIGLMVLYYLAPNVKIKFKYVLPGAITATIGSMLLSQLFSVYLQYFAKSVTSYKTLGTFIVIMFWLNFSALILLLGGVINATVQELKTKGELEKRI